MKEQLINSFYILLPTLVFLGWWLVVSYQKAKKNQYQQLQPILLELETEKIQQQKLQSVAKKINALESATQLKFRKINLEIATVDFSLKEIL